MGLTKIRKRRAIKEAKKKLIDIISHISDLTEIDWAKKDVQHSVKKDLCEFVVIIKENKLEYLIQDLNDIDCLFDYCIDVGVDDNTFTLLCLQTYLPIILDTISLKSNVLD